jgi:hypothetical protein
VLCAAVWVLVGALGAPQAAAGDAGLLRIAHLSPDTPAVDVAVAPLAASEGAVLTDPGPDLAPDLGYGDVGEFHELPAGSYAVSLRAAGSDRATPPVLSTRVEVPAGGARTVAISGRFADLSLRVLTENLTAPPSGSTRVRVLAAAAGAEALDVTLAGGPTLAAALPFSGIGDPVVVPAGPATVRVDGGPGTPVDLPVDFAAGSVATLLVLDRPDGGLTVRVVLDAAGPALVPAGGVEAGGGGTTGPPVGPAAAGVAVVAVLAGVRRRGRIVLVVAALAVALGSAAAAPGVAPPSAVDPRDQEVFLAADLHPLAAAPTWLRVPAAGVDTALTGIGLDAGGALVPPQDDALAGWYRQGPAPGDAGPAVLAGHVDSVAGPAVFFRLDDLAVGDPVLVGRADGTTLRFTVTRVARYAKNAFPAAEVYGPTPDPQLRLITCGGDFDRSRRSYTDNIVVFARQAP